MIEREFCDSEGSEAIGFSHGDFRLVIQSFDDAAGEGFASTELVEEQLPMVAQGYGNLLHRPDW